MTGESGNFAGSLPDVRTSAEVEQVAAPAVASIARGNINGVVFRPCTVFRDRLKQYAVGAACHPELQKSKGQVARC
jgi:hypothetical protein